MEDAQPHSIGELAGGAVALCRQKFVPLAIYAAIVLAPAVVFGLLPRHVSRSGVFLYFLVQDAVGALGIAGIALIVDAARKGSALSFTQIASRIGANAPRLVIVSLGYLLLMIPVGIAAAILAWGWSGLVYAAGYEWNWHDGTANVTLTFVFFSFPASFVGMAGLLACAHIVLGDPEPGRTFRGIDVLRNPSGRFAGAGIVAFLPAAVLYFAQLYALSTFKLHAPSWVVDIVGLPYTMWYAAFGVLLYFDLLTRQQREARFDLAAAQAAAAKNVN